LAASRDGREAASIVEAHSGAVSLAVDSSCLADSVSCSAAAEQDVAAWLPHAAVAELAAVAV
jgi:hypothetical protein